MPTGKKKKRQNKPSVKNLIYLVSVILVGVAVFAVGLYEMLKKNAESEKLSQIDPDKYQSLYVNFIDIGQGDAILINFPDGKNMIIDFGRVEDSVVDEHLMKDGKKLTIDYLVATHPDDDHIGELPYIYENYEVKRSYRPYVLSENSSSSVFDSDFNQGVDINKNTVIYHKYINSVYTYNPTSWEFFTDDSDFKGEGEFIYSVDFMMPYIKELSDYSLFKDANNFSAIIMIEYAGKKILFMGDAENSAAGKGAEDKFRLYYEENDTQKADCDVLKVGHHGSDTSSSKKFLQLVKPEYAVISCGVKNTYKHPHDVTLKNIINSEAVLYRTDLQGDITLEISPRGEISFKVETNANNKYLFDDGLTIKSVSEEILKEKADARAAKK